MKYKRICLVTLLLGGSAPLTADDSGYAGERFDCLIEPMMVINVGSPAQGIIKSLKVERSELVEAGQVIADLQSDVELAALEQARARAQMVGEIRAREADLALAHQSKSRVAELFEKSMASTQQRDEAYAKVKVAEMAVKQAIERRSLAEHEYNWSRAILQRRTIKSPIAGVVVERRAYPGEFVYENPIMTIAQVNPLRVEVILPIELYGQLKTGMSAQVYPEIGGVPRPATISVIDRLMDPGSSTFGARLELPNENYEIPGGQRCEIAFLETSEHKPELAALDGTSH